ncbi:TonB family protein [Mesorhizobium sp. 8]|uniref:TonB family protein n=1 Tax=Mesorhizobium sp. 8 TaxID=2584466 RepID=UPI00111D1208|nr:TonB family protein [Mesorhizobium sp. 8]QDC00756.1 TonB family protein [Mesorhizobium sp. 8]
MTADPAEIALAKRSLFKDAGLWLGAGAVVLFAHAASAYLLRDFDPVPEHAALEQAMEIDLAPLPVSVPEAVQSEALAQEQPPETIEPMEAAEAVQPEPEQAVETPAETAQRAQPETVQPVTDEAEPEPVETTNAEPEEPELVEEETVAAVTPEVAIPLPQPRPERPVEEKAEPSKKKPVRRKAETADKKAKEAELPKRKATPPASQASAASRAPTIDPSRWNSAVRAAIARRAGAVRGMRGTVRVSFVVSSSGAIVSASVSGSSGDARLDQAALRMVRSARVPAPPAGLGGSRHAFAIPLSFR